MKNISRLLSTILDFSNFQVLKLFNIYLVQLLKICNTILILFPKVIVHEKSKRLSGECFVFPVCFG